MKRVIFVILTIIVLSISCESMGSTSPLYTQLNETVNGNLVKNSPVIYNDAYIDVRLGERTDHGYSAGYKISDVGFNHISDEKGVRLIFETSTEFLNYMNSRGFEMVSKNKVRYGFDFTFKKK